MRLSLRTTAPYSMTMITPPPQAGVASSISFRITGADGKPTTDYDVVHEKPLHLFSMRDAGTTGQGRFSDFQHLHPTYAGDGVWTLDNFVAPSSGTNRLVADITVKGTQSWVQGSQVVPGTTTASPPTSAYAATIVSSMPMGNAIMATVQLTGPDGKPVAAVDPFLGAPAHWALFNTGSKGETIDAAHAHPMKFANGRLQFHIELPTSGAYQGWIQFQPTGASLVTLPLSVSGDAAPASRPSARRRASSTAASAS